MSETPMDMDIEELHEVSRSSAVWVEKYRPKNLNDVAHQEEVVNALKSSIKTNNLPHLLFYGPPGTGKTTCALAAARELFGVDFKRRVLELNSSDERGINVIRTKVKVFAQIAASNTTSDGKSCPPYKIIILDEADAMTSDAQSSLRRIMERYSKVTRFMLICNYVSKIIEPIVSRCAKFRFQPLEATTVVARLQHISTAEGCNADRQALEEIERVSGGDMRKAITYLQTVASLHGSHFTPEIVDEIAGNVSGTVVTEIMEACQANSFERMQARMAKLLAEGYPAIMVVDKLTDVVMESVVLDDLKKGRVLCALAKVDKALSDGASEKLQLLALGSSLVRAFSE
eukprot:GCRY01002250.1.p1 GENE.GCRY01002250.1~~GCRY01002250.1.p1  ORF type:complete len:344 (+),score=57.85 GCRY01002250.1:100-1131(+)